MINQNRGISQDDCARADTLSSATFLILAVAVLGVALQISSGFYDEIALLLLLVSFVFCTLGTLRPKFLDGAVSSPNIMLWILRIALAGNFALLFRVEILFNVPLKGRPDYWLFEIGIAIAALLTLWPTSDDSSATSSTRWVERARLPLLLLTFCGLAFWAIGALRSIEGDVLVVQRDSAQALLQGINPYGITFADPYNRDMTLYKPEHIANGRLLFGYVYPPLSLMMILPALLFGDIRFALALFWALCGALIGFTRPSKHSVLWMSLWLFTPRVFFALIVGWTEPMLCAMLALTVFIAMRQREKWAPIAFGLLLALKQYTFFLLPLSGLLTQSKIEYSMLLKRALFVVAIVSLPMILWNIPAFLHSAIRLNFTLPFRLDGLNITVFIAKNTGFVMPTIVGFLLAAFAVFVALKRCERTPFGFASATAWVYFVFFLFGRQGFANYYLFVMCAMCCALATLEINHQDTKSTKKEKI